jgi:hypothetical protein
MILSPSLDSFSRSVIELNRRVESCKNDGILYQLPILFKVQERFIVCIEIAQQVFNLDLQLHKFNDKK